MRYLIIVVLGLVPWFHEEPSAQTPHGAHHLDTDAQLLLPAVVAAAIDRHPDAARLAGLQAEYDALAAVARTPFAGPAVAALRIQNDLPGTAAGLHEYEARIELPLKRPHESAVQRRLANIAQQLAGASSEASRWQVAGLVRESLWNLAIARAERDAAAERLRSAEQLAAAVTLVLFLGNARAALTVVTVLPLAALVTFWLMRQFDM